MNKILSIGDLHGLTIWKTIDPNLYDKIIFAGDFVDSFNISDEQILNNLLDVIQFKKDNTDKIILLLGNHDLQYLFQYELHGCSGYRPQMYPTLHSIFKDNKELFQLAYQIDDTIWTHAGVHEGWYKERFDFPKDEAGNESLSDTLNAAFDVYYKPLFDVSHLRGGRYKVGGPFWCDARELKSSPIREYNQIVGHTRMKYMQHMNIHNKEITFIDVLEESDFIKENLFYYKEF